VISCYEGPISASYFATAGGAAVDCSSGCKSDDVMNVNSDANSAVCKSHQCQYRLGNTCFTGKFPAQRQ